MEHWVVVLKSGEKATVEGKPDRKDGKLIFEEGSYLKALFDLEAVEAFYPVQEAHC